MTAVTITELSTEDLPVSRVSGTGRRKKIAHIRYDSAGATEIINLQNLVPESTIQIQAILGDDVGTAQSSTAVTYTGATAITTAGIPTGGVSVPSKVTVLYDVI